MRRLVPALLVFFALLTAGCLPQGAPAPPAQPRPQPIAVPASVDSSGRTDVSRQFAAFLATVPDGSTIDLAPSGKYRMESTLFIDGRHGLAFRGNGATIFATSQGDRDRANIRVRGGADIMFRDLNVKGANPNGGKDGPDPWLPDWEAQHAFDALGVQHFTLDNVTATDTHGDFVHLSRWKGAWTDGVLIKNSRFERSGRQGIALVAVRNVVIENNTLSDLRRATFDLEPDDAPGTGVQNVVIRNNQIGPGRLMFVAAAGHGPVDDITIEGNKLTGQALQIFVNDQNGEMRRNWRIVNNRSDLALNNPHRSAMRIWRVDGLEIRGNRQPFTPNLSMVGANIDSSCRLRVDGNDYPNAVAQARVTGTC